MSSHRFHSRVSGFLLVEAMLVAGVVIVGCLAALLLYNAATKKGGVHETIAHARQLISNVERGWGLAQSYHGLSASTAHTQGLIPPQLVRDGNAHSPWGPIDMEGMPPEYESFRLRFHGVPDWACHDLVMALIPSMTNASINQRLVIAGRQWDVGQVASACAEGGTVEFERWQSGMGLKASWETW